MYCIVLYHIVLYSMYCRFCIVLYCRYCVVLYCIVGIVLYCIVLCRIVLLFYIVLYFRYCIVVIVMQVLYLGTALYSRYRIVL